VDAEYFRCNNGGDGEAIKDVYEGLPYFDATPSFTLVIESVYCSKRGEVLAIIASHEVCKLTDLW
jgi:hypothetical protein